MYSELERLFTWARNHWPLLQRALLPVFENSERVQSSNGIPDLLHDARYIRACIYEAQRRELLARGSIVAEGSEGSNEDDGDLPELVTAEVLDSNI
ncbi:hypothetical protein QCA50_016411 [Cerrena zonata]|uniref:Uncharacterized protein n=1 Tax=Cerrena zonata TaxID=2478898 RepID=A0AAW0FNN9_9APHY